MHHVIFFAWFNPPKGKQRAGNARCPPPRPPSSTRHCRKRRLCTAQQEGNLLNCHIGPVQEREDPCGSQQELHFMIKVKWDSCSTKQWFTWGQQILSYKGKGRPLRTSVQRVSFLIKLFVMYQPLHSQDSTQVLNKITDLLNIGSWIMNIIDMGSIKHPPWRCRGLEVLSEVESS